MMVFAFLVSFVRFSSYLTRRAQKRVMLYDKETLIYIKMLESTRQLHLKFSFFDWPSTSLKIALSMWGCQPSRCPHVPNKCTPYETVVIALTVFFVWPQSSVEQNKYPWHKTPVQRSNSVPQRGGKQKPELRCKKKKSLKKLTVF